MVDVTRTLDFTIYADRSPWSSLNSSPAFPANYTLGGGAAKILASKFGSVASSVNAVILDDTVLTGNEISAECVLGTVASSAQGVCLCTPTGTGYQALFNNSNVRIYTMTNFVLGAQVGSAIVFVATTGHKAQLKRNNTTGVMEVSTAPVADAFISRGSVTQANANTDWRAGCFVRDSAAIPSMTSRYTPAQTVDSFNSASDIQVGQQDVVYATTGFSAVTSITTNRTGVSFSGISDTTGDGNADISDRVTGNAFPNLPVSVTYTFVNGSDTATVTKNLVKKTTESVVTFNNMVLTDNTFLGAELVRLGLSTADGNRGWWVPGPKNVRFYDDDQIAVAEESRVSNGIIVADDPTTVTVWYWIAATGIVHQLNVTVAADVAGEPGTVTITRALKQPLKTKLRHSLRSAL